MKVEELKITVNYNFANIVCGAVVLIFGLVFYFYAVPYHISESFSALSSIGPKTFPSAFSFALMVLGVALLYKSHKNYQVVQKLKKEGTPVKDEVITFSGIALIIAVIGIVYTALLETGGYIIINTITMVGFYYMFGGKSWWKGILLGVGVSLALWLFFAVYLDLAIPRGLLLGG